MQSKAAKSSLVHMIISVKSKKDLDDIVQDSFHKKTI